MPITLYSFEEFLAERGNPKYVRLSGHDRFQFLMEDGSRSDGQHMHLEPHPDAFTRLSDRLRYESMNLNVYLTAFRELKFALTANGAMPFTWNERALGPAIEDEVEALKFLKERTEFFERRRNVILALLKQTPEIQERMRHDAFLQKREEWAQADHARRVAKVSAVNLNVSSDRPVPETIDQLL